MHALLLARAEAVVAQSRLHEPQLEKPPPDELRERLLDASASANWWEARFAERNAISMTPEQRRIHRACETGDRPDAIESPQTVVREIRAMARDVW